MARLRQLVVQWGLKDVIGSTRGEIPLGYSGYEMKIQSIDVDDGEISSYGDGFYWPPTSLVSLQSRVSPSSLNRELSP